MLALLNPFVPLNKVSLLILSGKTINMLDKQEKKMKKEKKSIKKELLPGFVAMMLAPAAFGDVQPEKPVKVEVNVKKRVLEKVLREPLKSSDLVATIDIHSKNSCHGKCA